jgi:hypothetical protein
MTDPDQVEAMRRLAREVLREVVPEMLADAAARPHANGHADADIVPRVPARPVAAVLRPSTWTGPAVPGEVIGDPGPATRQPEPAPAMVEGELDAGVEAVTIDTDEDLDRFVHALLARLESPRERRAIRSGQVRFALRRSAIPQPGAEVVTLRIAKGAVTERVVRDAADRGVRLVLARGAVLTPLARDQARTLGVEVEREGKC